jgi:ABC-2 type transport system ATP-binding protein
LERPESVIELQQLCKRYGGKKPATAVLALDKLSLQVPSGSLYGLLGPNGAGKTTALRILCTLLAPDSGSVRVGGIDALADPRAVRRLLGYVAQEVAIDKILTGRELLQLQGDIYHLAPAARNRRMDELIELLGMADWIDRRCGSYSGGMRRRLDLAAGLLHSPQVLVLDEPTVGLDIESRSAVWGFLRQLRAAGTTVLITSHYLEEVDALADQVAIIDHGRVIASGRPSDLKDQLGGDRITLRLREFTTLAEAEQARQQLSQLPVVQAVIINTAQGNSLNLVVDRQTDALGMVQQALVTAGLPVFGIAQARPSLDDVYLAATGRTLMDAELAAVGQRDLKQEKKQAMKGG